MFQKIVSSENEISKAFLEANLRVNDAIKRLINLKNSKKSSSEIHQKIIIESDYIRKLILIPLNEMSRYYAYNKEVMILRNNLEKSIFKFKKICDKINKEI